MKIRLLRSGPLRLGALAVAAAVLTAACAAGGSGGAPAASGASGSGGELVVGTTMSDLPNLDTTYAFSVGGESMRWVGLQLYDGLTAFDLSNPAEIPPVTGGLAESWESNADATEWTFHLRPNVTFTDGTPWNADAAVFNIKRYTDPTDQYYSDKLKAVSGLYLGGVGGATKVDDMTVAIQTKGGKPYSFLLQDLALLPMGSPTAIAADPANFGQHPVGTGPFRFESRVDGQSITLARNDSYWKGAAKLDKLTLRFIPDPTARSAALRAGEVNFIETTPPDDLASLKTAGYQIASAPYSNVWRGVFDTTQAPWNDVRVRQAANIAIDRKAIADSVLSGIASPAYQPASAADPGYLTSLDQTYAYDPAKAKQLLADAGYPNGLTATFSYPSSGSGSMDGGAIASAMQQQLAQVGINLELKPMEFATLSSEQNSGKMPSGASLAGWSGTFVLPSLWSVLTPTGNNVGKWVDPQMGVLFDQAKAATDLQAQTAAFEQMNTIATEQAAWLPIATDTNPRALAPTVHDFSDPKSWFLDVRSVWVG
jgi:peptide/nickel transport system substrate-binding protein